MTAEYRDAALEEVRGKLAVARAAFTVATPRTKAWRDAEEELNFWQSKAAFLNAPASVYHAAERAGDYAYAALTSAQKLILDEAAGLT